MSVRAFAVVLAAGVAVAGCQEGAGGAGSSVGIATPGAAPPRDLFYLPDVQPLLAVHCAQCHAGGDATAQAAYPLSASADTEADFGATRDRTDAQAPAASLLLQKAAGAGGHPALLAPGDAAHDQLLSWIAQGGAFESGAFLLAWDPNPEPDVAGYRVYLGMAPGAYGPPLDAGNRTTYRLRGLVPGTRYYVTATAYDTAGHESGFSAEVSKVAR